MQGSAHTDSSFPIGRIEVPGYREVEPDLARVRQLMSEQLTVADMNGQIGQVLSQMDSRIGKMIRPVLVLLVGRCCGLISDQHIRAAAVVEMIHNATLLHDDVIDEGRTRRGQPTINKLWGNESAILLGDFLLSRVFKICADFDPDVAREIASTAAHVCEGELRQVVLKRNWDLTEAEYIEIIKNKTASLFGVCCYLGAHFSQADKGRIEMLRQFGLNIGIAFQITDDLLDITGSEKRIGKTAGRDVDKNKPTLPLIHLLNTADKTKKQTIETVLQTDPQNRDVLKGMFHQAGSLDYAESQARMYVEKAMAAINEMTCSDSKTTLCKMAAFITRRTA